MILSMPFPGSSSKKTGQTKGENVSLWEKNSSGDGQQTEENIVQEPVQAASAKPARDYEKELERYRRTHKGDFTLQRYKGLGEMDAEQLWETTLDPERRVLKRVEIEDARLASEVTEMLMGSEVGPRRQFIYEHADEAEIDA